MTRYGADYDLPFATRLDLQEVLARLEGIAPDDTRAVAGWEQIRKSAPKVWEIIKPVLVNILGAGLKKYLGLP